VGCAVTVAGSIRRVACSMTTTTERMPNMAVTTIQTSQATIAWAWLRTKVRQHGDETQ
jgi:hypothetical protein